MTQRDWSRRELVAGALGGAVAASVGSPLGARAAESASGEKKGDQRLPLDALRRWEALQYGMFIHFGMSTFVANELPDGKAPATTYAPDRLDVDQWVSVARDAGMKYAVLTTKHVAGHCLWPSRHTRYTVANSTSKADVVEAFVKSCAKRGVLPGFYYCSWDNHNRFGSKTPSDPGHSWAAGSWTRYNFREPNSPPPDPEKDQQAYTTSVYQGFQTAQIRELLTQYGPIAETWIDIPGVLGMGYRTFLYQEIARLQPQTVVMMNSGIGSGENYDVDYAWPSDLIAIERERPPAGGHRKWRTIEGREYYMPGEICDPIGKEWFFVEGDKPRGDEALLDMFATARKGGVNLLLDVPPDKHGLIPDESVQALMRLRKNVGI